MTDTATIALGRTRGAVVVGLVALTAASWAYLGFLTTQMGDMSSVLAMPMTSAWSPTQAALMVTMWAVMMAAMMLPSAVPMVLAYDRMDGGAAKSGADRQRCSSPATSWCGRRSPPGRSFWARPFLFVVLVDPVVLLREWLGIEFLPGV